MSRAAALTGLLARYGQPVDLHPAGQAQGQEVRAFLQPIRETGKAQYLATPVGARRQDRFLYLGPPEGNLSPGDGSWLEFAGGRYEPETVQPIYIGSALSHWWAVLRPREEEP
jgi:hypothetical protein